MKIVEVRTQAEMEACLRAGDIADLISGVFNLITSGVEAPEVIVRTGATLSVNARDSSQPRVNARDSSQPRINALDSSQPRVDAWDSSQPRINALDSSQPRINALDSSQPRVDAWDSSQPRVNAWDSSQPRVNAWGSSQPRVNARDSSQPRINALDSSQPRVEASAYAMLSLSAIWSKIVAKCSAGVSVHVEGDKAKVTGGKKTYIRPIKTAKQWCEYYGVPVIRGVAILYKATDAAYRTSYGGVYAPGSMPEAKDWDGGKSECGGGLHFCPIPSMCLDYEPDAKKFVACPVRLKDISVHYPVICPNKVKARGVCAPVYECDIEGNKIDQVSLKQK